MAILGRCADLGLAIVFMEGVTVHADGVDPLAGHKADLGETNAGGPFALFQAECNTQAAALLERWPRQRSDFGVAIEVQDAGGERFVQIVPGFRRAYRQHFVNIAPTRTPRPSDRSELATIRAPRCP